MESRRIFAPSGVRTSRVIAPAGVVVLGLVLTALLLLSPRAAIAGDGPSGGGDSGDAGARIVERAKESLGKNEGQCFPWVRRVVHEAIGAEMGFSYHQGYLQGGAVEVDVDDVQHGDIIQLIDPDDTAPNASHPGMHTVIVIEPNGDGTLKIIDANSQWDGIVRIRESYDLEASLERFDSVQARAYRFSTVDLDAAREASRAATQRTHGSPAPVTSTQNDNGAAISSDSAALTVGSDARIVSNSCLNLRSTPDLQGNVVTCLADGTRVTLLDGNVEADGHVWRQVRSSSGSGWVAESFLASNGGSSGAAHGGSSGASDTISPVASQPPPPPDNTGQILTGAVPASGGVGLISWGGGTIAQVRDASEADGCGLLSVWATAEGDMLGFILNAPEFVNQTWLDRFPADLAEGPLLVVCGGAGGPTQPVGAPSSPGGPAGPATGDGPPGPAGNE